MTLVVVTVVLRVTLVVVKVVLRATLVVVRVALRVTLVVVRVVLRVSLVVVKVVLRVTLVVVKSPSADEANDGSKQRRGCRQSATTARAAHTAATWRVPLDTDATSMREGTHNGPSGCHGPSPTSTTNRSHGANSGGSGHG